MRSARAAFLGVQLAAAMLIVSGAALAEGSPTSTLDGIREGKVIRLAYREDAPPFSYKDNLGKPAGFMVDLCKAVAGKLTEQLNLPSLSVIYVPVTAADRFDTIQQHKADLLCEPTSATLSRRELVDFSIATFTDGASFMIRTDSPLAARDLQAFAGRKVGVLAGTTTEEALRNSLRDAGVTAEVIPAKTHADGLAMLDDAEISVYFGDRSILAYLIKDSKAPEKLALADKYLTVEPYALALARGDEEFRLAVDRALSRIYRSGQIDAIFDHAFGGRVKPGEILQTLYLISALPE
jgi:polar amino acid transport system substrate-binding protein/glutamate/aspartate transport system substrate-binding protein